MGSELQVMKIGETGAAPVTISPANFSAVLGLEGNAPNPSWVVDGIW